MTSRSVKHAAVGWPLFKQCTSLKTAGKESCIKKPDLSSRDAAEFSNMNNLCQEIPSALKYLMNKQTNKKKALTENQQGCS